MEADLNAVDTSPAAPDNTIKNLVLQAALAAVPALIGSAFGTEGALAGSKAGGEAQKDFTKRLDDERVLEAGARDKLFDRSVKTQVLANQKEGLNIKREGVKAQRENAAATRGLKGQIAQRGMDEKREKNVRDFQEKFNTDSAKLREEIREVPVMMSLIEHGSGQDFNAVKFKLATMFNGARPTDADVAAFGGKQNWTAKFNQYMSMKANDSLTGENKEEFKRMIGTLERAAKRNLSQMGEYRAKQYSARSGTDAGALMEALQLDALDNNPQSEDEEKDALIEQIMGGAK